MRISRVALSLAAATLLLPVATACSSPSHSPAASSSRTAAVAPSSSEQSATAQPTNPSVDATPVNGINPCEVMNLAHVDTITGVKGWATEWTGTKSINPASGPEYSTDDHRTCFYADEKTAVVVGMVETYVADGDVNASYNSALDSVSGTAGNNQYETIRPTALSNLNGVTQLTHAFRVSPVTKVIIPNPTATIIRLDGVTFVAWFQNPQSRTTFASVDYALWQMLQNWQKRSQLS